MRATWPGLRIGNRSLNNIRLWILTSSIVVATSALSGQAQSPNKVRRTVKSLAVPHPSVDDSADIASSQRYRMRSLTLDPGSAIILRGDKGRSTLVHVIKGTLTSHPQDMPEVVLHAGDGYAGIEDSECLLENTGSEPAEFIWLPVYRYTP
jgi:Quercetinase C-terminal cupin domain